MSDCDSRLGESSSTGGCPLLGAAVNSLDALNSLKPSPYLSFIFASSQPVPCRAHLSASFWRISTVFWVPGVCLS